MTKCCYNINNLQVYIHEVVLVEGTEVLEHGGVLGGKGGVNFLPALYGRQVEALADGVVVGQPVVAPSHDVKRP